MTNSQNSLWFGLEQVKRADNHTNPRLVHGKSGIAFRLS